MLVLTIRFCTIEETAAKVSATASVPSPAVSKTQGVSVKTTVVAPKFKVPHSLAEILENETGDQKDCLKSWINSHPSLAAKLTPNDVTIVLSKITFSLDQPDVAKILSQGIRNSGGSVTTSHILAAMEQCSFQDAEMAKEMAPYVSDVENKCRVLDALRMSFTKSEVSRCFPSSSN